MNEMNDGKAVLVTTEFRGIFFGYVVDDSQLPEQITLSNVRNCLYFAKSVGGFLGLAAKGPDKDCLIGTEAPSFTLYKITGVAPVTEKAAAAWKSA